MTEYIQIPSKNKHQSSSTSIPKTKQAQAIEKIQPKSRNEDIQRQSLDIKSQNLPRSSIHQEHRHLQSISKSQTFIPIQSTHNDSRSTSAHKTTIR